MRSVALALIWELLFYGGGWLLLFAGASLALPLLLFTALEGHGPIDAAEPSFVIIHLALVQISMFVFAAGLMAAQRPVARLFTLPVTSATMVTWYLIPAMSLMAIETILSTVLLNSLFGLNWPITGPAVFAAVSFAAVVSIAWYTEKSAWLTLGMMGVATVLGLWFKSRHGPIFSLPMHYWREFTLFDFLTLTSVGGLAYYVGILGVSRNRCGETLRSLGIVKWFERVFDRLPQEGPAFETPLKAQAWFEWRTKGWAMPVCTLFALSLGLIGWLIVNREPKQLLEGVFACGGLLSVIACVGSLVMGNMGPHDLNYEMGHFISTRPISSVDLARIVLRNSAISVLISWVLWGAGFLMVGAILYVTQTMPEIQIPKGLLWWYLPITLLGPWTIVAVGASIGLTGRPWHFFWPAGILFAIIQLSFLWARNVLSLDDQIVLREGFLITAGCLVVVATAWLMLTAWQRKMLPMSAVCSTALAWLGLSVLVLLNWQFTRSHPLGLHVLIVGLLALSASPLATTPLALAWNRNR